jgi:hypothetical protein
MVRSLKSIPIVGVQFMSACMSVRTGERGGEREGGREGGREEEGREGGMEEGSEGGPRVAERGEGEKGEIRIIQETS